MAEHDPLDPLRAAVARTPGDILLRERLACTLLDRGLAAEAELEYRASLQQAPDNPVLKLGLARAFLAQGKASHALAVVDSLVAEAGVEPAALVLHARLLLGIGEVDQAVRQYKRGVQADPAAADAALGATLGVDSAPRDDVVDGRVRASWNSEDDVVGIPMERPRISFADVGTWSLAALVFGFMLLPVSAVTKVHAPRARRIMTWYAAVMGFAGVMALATSVLAPPDDASGWKSLSTVSYGVYLLGLIGVTWVANVLAQRREPV